MNLPKTIFSAFEPLLKDYDIHAEGAVYTQLKVSTDGVTLKRTVDLVATEVEYRFEDWNWRTFLEKASFWDMREAGLKGTLWDVFFRFVGQFKWLKYESDFYIDYGLLGPEPPILTIWKWQRGKKPVTVDYRWDDPEFWALYEKSEIYADFHDRECKDVAKIFSFLHPLSWENDTDHISLDKVLEICRSSSVCWYPSAGEVDLRDMVYLNHKSIGEIAPTVFLHTDHDSLSMHTPDSDILFKDDRTQIKVLSANQIQFPDGIHFDVLKEFVHFPDSSFDVPVGIWFKLEVTSERLGNFTCFLAQFAFENTNFLREILLKRNVKVDWLYHNRDGAGWGGNAISACWLYSMTRELGLKYIVSDHQMLFGDEASSQRTRVPRVVDRYLGLQLDPGRNHRFDTTDFEPVEADLGNDPDYPARGMFHFKGVHDE